MSFFLGILSSNGGFNFGPSVKVWWCKEGEGSCDVMVGRMS